MFRHYGKARSQKQNIEIASSLSFVAGLVNVGGFLAVQVLTTNITGHFAFFAEELVLGNSFKALMFFLYAIIFFAGAFFSSIIIEIFQKVNGRFVFIFPISIVSLILLVVALYGQNISFYSSNLVACLLLFSMGMQNALVTKISGAVIRTTHLTGMFTDLGIDLSHLFFQKSEEQVTKLKYSIKLRSIIISFFFLGGLLSGILFEKLGFKLFLIGVFILVWGLMVDFIKYRMIKITRRGFHKFPALKKLITLRKKRINYSSIKYQ
jgi:uncharacterized membrane protein YoaK (UPF0700 family)